MNETAPPDISALPLPAVTLLRVTFVAPQGLRLPALPSTALHGLLGRSLWREVCVAPARDTCRGCPAESRCAFPPLFDNVTPTKDHPVPGVVRQAPRQLVMAPEPPLAPIDGTPPRVGPGSRVSFRFSLIGGAEKHTDALLAGLRRAGRTGLGPRRRRWPFSLERADRMLPLARPQADRATLELLTPLRLKIDGRIASDVDALGLVKNLVRRARALAGLAGTPWPGRPDVGGIASDLELETDLRVVEVRRYSSRQGARMSWPGLMGRIRLRGPGLAALWPLLEIGEKVQLGKGTSFGFGRYRIVAE